MKEWELNKIQKRTAKCILANFFFQPTNKVIRFVTHRTYSFANSEKSYARCNSSDLIVSYNMWEKLSIWFAKRGTGLSKIIKYTLQIIRI